MVRRECAVVEFCFSVPVVGRANTGDVRSSLCRSTAAVGRHTELVDERGCNGVEGCFDAAKELAV